MDLQFDKAEPATPETARACGRCRRSVVDAYFELAGHVICGACAAQLGGAQAGHGPGGGSLARALVFGAGAALLGTIAWFVIIRLLNRELGLVAIGVGMLVGFAVRRGGGGLGGWKYQAVAMALTYVSITAAYVPLVLRALEGRPVGVFTYIVVFGLAFASPFLAGAKNLMGLVIIGIALYQAWKLNRRVPITGPFRLAAP
jgi:hypothetical protein